MTPIPTIPNALLENAKEVVDRNFPHMVATLSQLARIPGIAWDAFDPDNLDKSAAAIVEQLETTGLFEFVEIRKSERSDRPGTLGSPAVVAKRAAKNGAPQILLYAHHDVQPPGDEEIWQTPPFEPTLVDGRIFGRGVADDKAGIVTHLAAITAMKAVVGDGFDLGITLFIEGEEEAGSPSFRNFLNENRGDLEADLIIVADSGNWTTEIPAITTTLRGLVSQVIELQTLDHAVHSGMFGGVIPDAMLAMIKLLATLHDERGNVAVDGLVEGKAADLNYSEADFRRDSGVLPEVDLIGDGSILDRNWTKPAITVIGIDGQSVALSSNTLLHAVKAKVSMRIAPGEDPEQALKLLQEHLRQHTPYGAKLTFHDVELGKPFQVDSSGWAKEAMEQALSLAFGRDSVDIGVGGSIPFIADLVEVFPNAQILVTGVEDPDSRAHSPNESVHVESLRKAMLAETLLLLTGNTLKG